MKRILCFLILLLLLSFNITALAQNDSYQSAQVDLIVSKNNVTPQEEFMVTLSFKNASSYPYGICAFTSTLTFDENAFALQKVNYNANEADITTNSGNGIYKSLYVFAPDENSKGFSDNQPFFTVFFKVKDSANLGEYQFGIDFDTISGVDYIDGQAHFFSVDFNKPTVNINVIEMQTSSQPQQNDSFIKDDDAQFTQSLHTQVDVDISSQSDIVNQQSDNITSVIPSSVEMEMSQKAQSSELIINFIEQESGQITEQNAINKTYHPFQPKIEFIIIFVISLAIILVIVIIIVVNRKNKN